MLFAFIGSLFFINGCKEDDEEDEPFPFEDGDDDKFSSELNNNADFILYEDALKA